jgi:hypothetical protein
MSSAVDSRAQVVQVIIVCVVDIGQRVGPTGGSLRPPPKCVERGVSVHKRVVVIISRCGMF